MGPTNYESYDFQPNSAMKYGHLGSDQFQILHTEYNEYPQKFCIKNVQATFLRFNCPLFASILDDVNGHDNRLVSTESRNRISFVWKSKCLPAVSETYKYRDQPDSVFNYGLRRVLLLSDTPILVYSPLPTTIG